MNRQESLTLNPATLHVKPRTPTRPDPEQLVTLGTTVWVYSAAAHTVTPMGAADPVLYLRNVAPVLESSGKTVAIEGIDQVMTMGHNGTVRQLPLISGSASSLAVTANGDVIATAPAAIIDIRG